ncbi:MAG: GNAT family N-acetyltransferase [bacterium]
MHLVPLTAADTPLIDQIGSWLKAIKPHRDPRDTILPSTDPGHFGRVAVDDAGNALGWLWGRPLFDGDTVWELRWLIVDPTLRGSGVGRALVGDYEAWLRDRGVLTCWLMTGEEMGETSLRGADLWADPFTPLQTIEPVANSPFVFWQRMGYRFIGVIPDANGPGVPEYLMGRSLRPTY